MLHQGWEHIISLNPQGTSPPGEDVFKYILEGKCWGIERLWYRGYHCGLHHPTPHCWPQTGAHTANTGLLMEAVLVYYLLLPSSSWQVPRGCPQAAQRNTDTIQTSNGSHPTWREDYILQEWKTTSYTEGGPRSTRREDHILHRQRTATEKRILLKLCCFLTLWIQCAGGWIT